MSIPLSWHYLKVQCEHGDMQNTGLWLFPTCSLLLHRFKLCVNLSPSLKPIFRLTNRFVLHVGFRAITCVVCRLVCRRLHYVNVSSRASFLFIPFPENQSYESTDACIEWPTASFQSSVGTRGVENMGAGRPR